MAALFAAALYGPIVAPHDPWETRALLDGKAPPFDPSAQYPLGSDALGRDRLSWLLYGARMTLGVAVCAALLRTLAGATLGVFAAWRGGGTDLLLSRIALGLASIPALVAALLGMFAFGVVGLVSFVAGLAVFGWADAFQLSRRAARTEVARPYVEAARSLGVDDVRLLWRHLMPNLAPSLLVIASVQISVVLQVMAELALIHVFFGGFIQSGLAGSLALLPAQPEWATTLAGTRPIFDLYVTPGAVIVPAGALIFAVLSFTLLSDALARRAQRLDLFHLFTLRQSSAFALGVIALTIPALAWPGPLAADVKFADRFAPSRALAVAEQLMSPELGSRVSQSEQADAAARDIASIVDGELVWVHESSVQTRSVLLDVEGRSVSLADGVVALSQQSASVKGGAVLVEAGTPFLSLRSSEVFANRVAFVRDLHPALSAGVSGLLARLGARALVIVSDETGFMPGPHELPTVRLSMARVQSLFGNRTLAWPNANTIALPVDEEVVVSLEMADVVVRGYNVVTRISSERHDAPLFLVVAPYDTSAVASPGDAAQTASSAAILVAVAEILREANLPADITLVAVAGQSFDGAGLRAALRILSASERRRLGAVMAVEGGTGSETTIRYSMPIPAGGGESLVGRLANALGARIEAGISASLMRPMVASDVRVPTLEFVGSERSGVRVDAEGLRAGGRALLVALSYFSRNPDKLK